MVISTCHISPCITHLTTLVFMHVLYATMYTCGLNAFFHVNAKFTPTILYAPLRYVSDGIAWGWVNLKDIKMQKWEFTY